MDNHYLLIPHLFKTEYSKIVAVLCKAFGLSHIQTAEDIASETFLLAAETWGKKGIPENQKGWLYAVAKNKTRDYLRRNRLFEEKILPEISKKDSWSPESHIDLSEKNITDSQLQMLFAICHPSIPLEAQIGLALRILCGFGINEIAEAFFSNKEAINKRLFRAKEKLRNSHVELVFPSDKELPLRLQTVLRTLYLLFNEGYYSANPNLALRKDLCYDAMRLVHMLTLHPQMGRPECFALLALMCFHASRFDARLDQEGSFILYDDQDVNLWDLDLIKKGEEYMNKSSSGERVSKYHLEAAIAYWHTRKEDEKWGNILQLYNHLLQLEYSPMAALNRTYALAKADGVEVAIIEAEKINLKKNHLYHCLLAELYQTIDCQKAIKHLREALKLANSRYQKEIISLKLKKIEEK